MGKPDCDRTLHELYPYLDGELTDEIRLRIQVHLDECPPCKGGYEFEVELRRVIAARCIDRVPDDLRSRIAAALREVDPAPGSGT